MSRTGSILVTVAVALSVVYAFIIFYTSERYCPSCAVDGNGVRFVQDYYDRSVYFIRGSWYKFGMSRVGALSLEYPPMAVYIFAIPFAIRRLAGLSQSSPILILNLLTAMMVPAYVGLIMITRRILRDMGGEEWRLFVFLLPAFLYFSLNRYDVIPALMVSAALLLALRGHSAAAGAILGLGFMTKWYPALLAPICFTYFNRQERKNAVLFAASFILAALLAASPMLISAGIHPFLEPFEFHIGRSGDPFSIFGLIGYLHGARHPQSVRVALLVMQLALPLLALLAANKTKEALLDWTILSILAFIFFSKFYSPQWIIWIVPLIILRSRGRGWIALLVALDLISYLLFPVFYDVYGIHDNPPGIVFCVAVIVKSAILIALAVDPARGAYRDFLEASRVRSRMEQA